MSRGVIDEEWAASCRRAAEHGRKAGKRPVVEAIYFNADGSRTFRWRYDTLDNVAPPPSMIHDPDNVEAENRRSRRGVVVGDPVQRPAQGELL